jgi:two-component system, LytTR family, sensor kinase
MTTLPRDRANPEDHSVPPEPPKTRRGPAPVLWPLLFVAAAFFFSLLNFLPLLLRNFRGAFNQEFGIQFLVQVISWFSWGLIVPLVIVFVRRLRRSRLDWRTQIPVHVAAAIVFVTAHSLIAEAARIGLLFLFHAPKDFDPHWSIFEFRSFGMHFPVYGLLLAGMIGFEYYRKYLDREVKASRLEAQLAQSQLQALKAQIHPHFLFNTLHGISALIPIDPEGAELMIGRLSELLRLTLKSSAGQEIPLHEEVETLGLYLDIMETRYKGRLSFAIEIDPGTENALVPNFILQPAVENAVRHGIAPRAEGGAVTIRARRAGETLVLEVADDGPGFRDDRRTTLEKGLGLSNTLERLSLIYGENGRLSLDNGNQGGARIVIEIPFHLDPDSRAGDRRNVP